MSTSTLQQPSCDTEAPAAGVVPLLEVADLAERRLRGLSYLALKNIRCGYPDGVLTLRGWLPTYYLKQLAQAAVADLEGVARIENRIGVMAPASAAGQRARRARVAAGE